MRKTIYFRDDGSYEAIKGSAEAEEISVSKYIVRKCLGSGVVSKTLIKESGQLDRIERKLDSLLPKGAKQADVAPLDLVMEKPKLINGGLKIRSYPGTKEEKDMWTNEDEESGETDPILDRVKKYQDGEPLKFNETIASKISKKVIKTVEDIPETFRSYSKDQQLGKRGKK